MSSPTPAKRPRRLRVLLVEDSPEDAELILLRLRQGGYDPDSTRVENAREMRDALESRAWDLVLSDYSLPAFSGPLALETLRETGKDLPFIVVTGTIGEEKAVALMKAGAHDFVLKGNLRRMVPAIERELREASNRRARRETEKERARLVTELREAVRARDEFLSIASHELNTPLTPLKLQAQALRRLLDRHDLPTSLERMVGKMTDLIDREIRRLAILVKDLLDVSRIRAGKLVVKPAEADLAHLLRDAIESLSTQVAEARVEIRVDSPEHMTGRFDPDRIEEVLFNLITNAVKYGEGKPVDVKIGEQDGHALIVVRDRGMGIAPEDQERIFNRFERATSHAHFSGLGLGLYIVRQILDAHGGTVRVESALGQGSTFTAEFPLRSSPPRSDAPNRSRAA
jgi:signal transduction histidine kinase